MEDKKINVTDNGIMYQVDGNEVKLCNFQQKLMDQMMGRKPGVNPDDKSIDIDSLSLSDYYNDELKPKFWAFNPQKYDAETLFYGREEDDKIGIKYVLIDTKTEQNVGRIIYKDNVGDLMEIIYIISHVGESFVDKRGHEYRFGTIWGINDVFSHYMTIIDSNPELEHLRRVMYYISGLIKGYCQETAYNVDMMMDVIEDVCDEYMLMKSETNNDNDDTDGDS